MKVQTYEEIYGKHLTIGDLIKGFHEDTVTGLITAFDGRLILNPKFQRNFIYNIDRQKAVINSVLSGYPLNLIYFGETEDGKFELMDGQQRLMSICKFCTDSYSVMVDIGNAMAPKTFSNLGSRKEDILNYPLNIEICSGSTDEKLKWFRIINIAGIKLTEQEMRNAVNNGPWVTNAKYYFSRDDCEGYRSEGAVTNGHIYGDYVDAATGKNTEKENAIVRQKLLETVLSWKVDAWNVEHNAEKSEKMTIDNYMDIHKNDMNALPLWQYYQNVMEWVKATFPTYRDVMKKVQWGLLYNRYKDADTAKDAGDKAELLFTKYYDEIDNPSKIFEAVLSGNLSLLNARSFSERDKKIKYEEQKHKCAYCGGEFSYKEMAGDHIIPWSKGGKTDRDNLQMLCTACNTKKKAHDVLYAPWNTTVYEDFDLDEWDKENGKEAE